MKIGIAGPSGTGKSTLAKWISENYKIENLNLSGKVLWPEYEIDSHEELIIKSHTNPDWGIEYQGNLLAYRLMELDKRVHSYVTDRTPIDNIVYMLLESSMHLSDTDTINFINNAIQHTFQYYTHIVITPLTGNEKEDDGKRVFNRYYQWMVDGIYKNVIHEYLLPYVKKQGTQILVLPEWDMKDRQKRIREFASPFLL